MTDKFRLVHSAKIMADAEGAVLLDVKAGAYYGLNGVASEIAQGLQQPMSAEELAECVMASHDVSREQAEADVERFLARLRERGFVATA